MDQSKVIPMWATVLNSPCRYGCKNIEITTAGKVKYREKPGTINGCRLPDARRCCIANQDNTRLDD